MTIFDSDGKTYEDLTAWHLNASDQDLKSQPGYNKETDTYQKPEEGAPEPVKFLFGRHGDTDDNDENRNRGQSEIPLNENGHRDAEKLAQSISDSGFGVKHIVASPLTRAKQTAQHLSDKLGIPVETDPRLAAWDVGHFTGQKDTGQLEKYCKDEPTTPPPGSSESFRDFQGRVMDAVGDLTEKYPEGAVIFGHNSTERTMDQYINGADYHEDGIEPGTHKEFNIDAQMAREIAAKRMQKAVGPSPTQPREVPDDLKDWPSYLESIRRSYPTTPEDIRDIPQWILDNPEITSGAMAGTFAGARGMARSVFGQMHLGSALEMEEQGKSAAEIFKTLGVYRDTNNEWKMPVGPGQLKTDRLEIANQKDIDAWDKKYGNAPPGAGGWTTILPDRPEPRYRIKLALPAQSGVINKIIGTVAPSIKPVMLPDVYHNPPLYRLYPELEDIEVNASRGFFQGAYYQPQAGAPGGLIELSQASHEHLLDVLEHEIQHAVQHIEGWPRGGNATLFKPDNLDEIDRLLKGREYDLEQRTKDILKKYNISDVNMPGEPNKIWGDVAFMGKYMTDEEFEKYMSGKMDKYIIGQDRKMALEVLRKNPDLVTDLRELGEFKKQRSAIDTEMFKRYMRLHGEVEARNAQYWAKHWDAIQGGIKSQGDMFYEGDPNKQFWTPRDTAHFDTPEETRLSAEEIRAKKGITSSRQESQDKRYLNLPGSPQGPIPKNAPRKPLNPDHIRELVNLPRVKLADVANALDVSTGHLRNKMKEFGIKFPATNKNDYGYWRDIGINEIRKGIESGKTIEQLSKEMNVTTTVIDQSIKKYGGKDFPERPFNRPKFTEADTQRYKSMREKGMSWDAIGKAEGIAGNVARLKAIRMGIHFRPDEPDWLKEEMKK